VPLGERKRAWVRLSTQAFTTLVFVDVAAVAIPPAATAPTRKAPMIFMFFISVSCPIFLSISCYKN
jgi:hypothetical protein